MAKKTNKAKDNVVIDVQSLFIPVAVIVVGVMISLALYFGLKDNKNDSSESSGTVAGEEQQQDDGDNPEDAQEAEFAVTSIDDDAILGDRNSAKVAIVEFSDYECPFCQRHSQETMDQIIKEYVDTGKVIYVFRDLPLSFHDPVATQEAIAAECVHNLVSDEAYYKYHDLLFENTKTNGDGVGGKNTLADLAVQVGADDSAFRECLDNEQYKDEVQKDAAAAGEATIGGTPGFVVGKLSEDGTVDGTIVRGAYPFSEFQRILDAALAD